MLLVQHISHAYLSHPTRGYTDIKTLPDICLQASFKPCLPEGCKLRNCPGVAIVLNLHLLEAMVHV